MKKQALITGISGGIGTALLKKFVKNDYFVIGQFCSNFDKINELKSNYSEEEAVFEQCDFSDIAQTTVFAQNMALRYPNIEVLVNNAGVSRISLFSDFFSDDIRKMTDVNLISPMIITREISKNMISNRDGKIVNISSIWGSFGGSCEVVYSATKGGLEAFTKALSKELGLSNVRVNCVSCGFIDTKMNGELSEDDKKAFCENLSLNRIGTPEEVADAVYYLCSDNSSYVTGQILGVNGGF